MEQKRQHYDQKQQDKDHNQHLVLVSYNMQVKSQHHHRWIFTVPLMIYSICFLCIFNNNIHIALASTTKTEIYEPNTVVLSEEEIESQLIRSLNDLNFNSLDIQRSNSKKLSNDAVMSPEDQNLYMAEIYNLMVNRKRQNLVKPTKSTIHQNQDNANDSDDDIVNPTKSTITSSEISNPMILEILQNIPNPELSSTLINLMFPEDTTDGKSLQDMSPQEQHETATRIAKMIPGAKVEGQYIEIKDNDNYKLANLLVDDYIASNIMPSLGKEASPLLTEDEQFEEIRKRAHDMVQEQVANAFANLEEGAQKVMDSKTNHIQRETLFNIMSSSAKQSKQKKKEKNWKTE